MIYKIGIDIGSTTVKTVVLSPTGEMLFHDYERHFSMVREKALEQLKKAESVIGGHPCAVAITGSAGLGVATAAGLMFVQEVYATAAAVREKGISADAVIELGGEDAKIIFFGQTLEERMNGTCAGGTGAFIDQMAQLLNVTITELDSLSLNYQKLYPVASRCGVFAKSDIQPILNQGGRHEDIAASIYQAVVDQTITGLAQGRELAGTIVFLGGPLTFLQGLRRRFIETLELSDDCAVFPENAECFAALGAALCADVDAAMQFADIVRGLESAVGQGGDIGDTLPPLFTSGDQYAEFAARHAGAMPPEIDVDKYTGDAFLGIDAGSTTTKLVLITPEGGILYSYYGGNKGNPVSIIRGQLETIYGKFGDRITIKGSAATGYGEELIKNAFNLDVGLVETMAHLRAARHFNPDVDYIIDIGGQDVKCFKIRNGAVDSIMLNEACSSGCGSFIETFAMAMGYNIEEFSKMGLLTQTPVDLGSRCTVFMNSSVKQAQKEGASVESISAGLSISVVKNAVYKVIRAASAEDLGRNIVVQGGTFLNDAVLRAFEQETGANVTRPGIAGLMGAYGAALSVRDASPESSTIITGDGLQKFSHTAKPSTCNACANKCSLTINTFDGDRKYISGNRCSVPIGKSASTEPNLIKYKYQKLRALHGTGMGNGTRGKIGIPFGLSMFETLSFWFEFFTELNFEVVLSEDSTRELYTRGQRTIPSDTVCYPAKIMHGQTESILDAGVDTIFMPCMPYNFDEELGDNNFNCPIAAYYPELLVKNMTRLKTANVHIPYFGLHKKKGFIAKASEYFEQHFGIPKHETKAAAKSAYKAYEAYLQDLEREADTYIEYARKNNKDIIVVAGRPYHADPEINHGIDELITALGLVLITEDAVSRRMGKEARKVLNQWMYQSRMYNAARFVAQHPDMQLVQLVSFGCGTDSITTDEMRDILESKGKLYTQLKIDDISNLGAAKIRLRSLIAATGG